MQIIFHVNKNVSFQAKKCSSHPSFVTFNLKPNNKKKKNISLISFVNVTVLYSPKKEEKTMLRLRFIMCTDREGRLGHCNKLIYQLPMDMARFVSLTKNHTVIMGYNTWVSLPKKPLPSRENWVVSRTPAHQIEIENEGGHAFASLDILMQYAAQHKHAVPLYVIGGADVFCTIASHPIYKEYIESVHWSRVTIRDEDPSKNGCIPLEECSRFDVQSYFSTWTCAEEWSLSRIPGQFSHGQQPPNNMLLFDIAFITLTRPTLRSLASLSAIKYAQHAPSAELQYLGLLRQIMEHGVARQTRNAATRSLFGGRIVIDLSNGSVPLLTTKRVPWKTVIKELLWFVRGETNNAILQQNNVTIWNENGARAFLDARGLSHYKEGDLGPVYGFQWRHAGATYSSCDADYTNQGVDQLENVRQMLINDPQSRRLLINAWNPADLEKMALPPCHILSQWYVDDTGRLWLQLYQRSGDMFLGVPFNLFSYAVLLHMMAHRTGIPPGGMVHILGDMHIYETHLEAVSTQLQRIPFVAPTLQVTAPHTVTWETFQLDHFRLTDYQHGATISAPMVA
jgi:thymidylate synthase